MGRDDLRLWQDRLEKNRMDLADDYVRMDNRERLYRGKRELEPFVDGVNGAAHARHVRNIVAENIESMVDSAIPQPKVTPRRKEDEWRAAIIENMIRNELDRLRAEEMNDMQERTVPIQGGTYWLVEWDNDAISHGIAGEVAVSVVHPKQVIPQSGVFTGVEDMDYVILAIPQTKAYIYRRYGKNVDDEGEAEPELRGLPEEQSETTDLVTQYIAFYRNNDGGIGLYSWVNDTELEDLNDYQARRRRRCVACGALEPAGQQAETAMQEETRAAETAAEAAEDQFAHDMWQNGRGMGLYSDNPAGIRLDTEHEDEAGEKRCPYCGGTEFHETEDDWEEIWLPVQTEHGGLIPGATFAQDPMTMEPVLRPTRIPAYKPGCYPVVLQKNVSVFGQLLGDSDVDKIEDSQNAINWLNQKIDRKIMEAGTIITGPATAEFSLDPKDHRILRLESAADKAMIDTYEFVGDITPEMAQLSQCYEEARQVLGITDSFQGRKDTTATSGKAKEFAAAQSAGRLESKRRMKDAAWSKIFELIFKFRLAYADEPRAVVSQDERGEAKYDHFDRYDFLERDLETGEWWWNDQFLFGVDTAAPLANSRETMWQESRMNFTSGAYGDPAHPKTRVAFWAEMEELHYPLAANAKKMAEEDLQEMQMQQQMMQQQAMMQATMPMAAPAMPGAAPTTINTPAGI